MSSSILANITSLEWIGIILLAAWMILSIVFQFTGSKIKLFVFWSLIGLLPSWSFFAPNPHTSDYHLLFRDKLNDGTTLAWHEVQPEKQRWWMSFWNPHMRQTKALVDILQEFKQMLKQSNLPWLEVSIPYLLLLYTVTKCSHPHTACSVQFLILVSSYDKAENEPEIIFLSRFHPIDDAKNEEIAAK